MAYYSFQQKSSEFWYNQLAVLPFDYQQVVFAAETGGMRVFHRDCLYNMFVHRHKSMDPGVEEEMRSIADTIDERLACLVKLGILRRVRDM